MANDKPAQQPTTDDECLHCLIADAINAELARRGIIANAGQIILALMQNAADLVLLAPVHCRSDIARKSTDIFIDRLIAGSTAAEPGLDRMVH